MDEADRLGLVVGAAIITNHLTYQNRINAYISQGHNYASAQAIVDREYAEQARIDKLRPWGWFGRTFLWAWVGFWILSTYAVATAPAPSHRPGSPNYCGVGDCSNDTGVLVTASLIGVVVGLLLMWWQRSKRRRWNDMWRTPSRQPVAAPAIPADAWTRQHPELRRGDDVAQQAANIGWPTTANPPPGHSENRPATPPLTATRLEHLHYYRDCDVNLAMCGEDISGDPSYGDVDPRPVCWVCTALANEPCERCERGSH